MMQVVNSAPVRDIAQALEGGHSVYVDTDVYSSLEVTSAYGNHAAGECFFDLYDGSTWVTTITADDITAVDLPW